MVTSQPIVTSISQDLSQSSSTSASTPSLVPLKHDSSAASVSLARGFSPYATVQSRYLQAAPSKVVLFSSPSITGAQVTPDLGADASETGVIVLRSGIFSPGFIANPNRYLLVSLPKVKISTQFEPHLRQASVKRLQNVMTEFQHSIGRPEVAVVREELKDALLETYKQAVATPETRSFATAVSMIQGFLRTHWSNLPQNQIAGIVEKLTWLDSQHDLGAATLTKFYRDLAGVVGSRISVEAPVVDDADDDEDDDDD
jgi:hypothetical protein